MTSNRNIQIIFVSFNIWHIILFYPSALYTNTPSVFSYMLATNFNFQQYFEFEFFKWGTHKPPLLQETQEYLKSFGFFSLPSYQ